MLSQSSAQLTHTALLLLVVGRASIGIPARLLAVSNLVVEIAGSPNLRGGVDSTGDRAVVAEPYSRQSTSLVREHHCEVLVEEEGCEARVRVVRPGARRVGEKRRRLGVLPYGIDGIIIY